MKLSDALVVNAPTLIYGVSKIADLWAVLEKSSPKKFTSVDCRSSSSTAELKSAAALGGPVLVLLGSEIHSETRSTLMDVVERVKVVAITSASAPTEGMGALFPMQIAVSRALDGGR